MRRIKRAKIKFISLVPRGANQMPVIYKEDGAVAFDLLTKAGADFDERGELLSVVYAPEIRDSQGDIASADVIKQMMYDAAKEGVQIDLRHNETPVAKADAYIAESFLIQKGDSRFADFKDYGGKVVDVTGAWAVVIKIDSPDLRKQYKEGKWNGVSMGGTAELLNEKSEPTDKTGDPDMTTAELLATLTAALTANNTALTKAVSEGVTASLTEAGVIKKKDEPKTKTEDAEPQPPKFKGNPSNIEDVRKHAAALKAFSLSKTIDWNDSEAVATHLATVEEMAKADGTHVTDEEAGILESDTPRERALKKELAKLKKASNQPGGKDKKETEEPATVGFIGLNKSADLTKSLSLAQQMVAHVSGTKTPVKAQA